MRSTWNPWRELRSRRHILFEYDAVAAVGGGAIYVRRGRIAAIVIDPALDRVERRAALAHELIHDERDGIADHPDMPPSWAAVVAREERTVEELAAARLVPLDELEHWVTSRITIGPVTALEVAEEWDVPERVAVTAMRLLRDELDGLATA